MSKHKYEIGDKVVYDGLTATVESQSEYAISGEPCYGLVSDEDEEMTCTASEKECEPYTGQSLEQDERLHRARQESNLIAYQVDRIADKYYRDGNH